jgi:acetoin utilization protein AcuB
MYVSNWMAKNVITLGPDDSVSDAITLMKEKRIKHLPIVKNDKLKGIVSDRDIKEFSPSKATTLDIYELHYLLAKTKIKDMMKTSVITTASDTPVEEAALMLLDQKIGCLPVVDSGKLVGIITDNDIFSALVDITGVKHRGIRIDMTLEDRPGSIREEADVIRKHGFHLRSILTSYEGVKDGYREVVLRTAGTGNFKGLKEELETTYKNVQVRKG